MLARHAPEHPQGAEHGEIVGTGGTWDGGNLITVRVGTEDRVYWSHGNGAGLAMNMAWYGARAEIVERWHALYFDHPGGRAWVAITKPGTQRPYVPPS